jgi:hypothetical protein
MTREEFIKGIKESLRDYGKEDFISALEKPPGRQPRAKDIMLSQWYNQLKESDKEKLNEVILEAIDSTLFGFLCILDHVTFLEDDEEKTQFQLYANKNGKKMLLNDFNEEFLHDIYNGLVQE